MSTSTRDDRQVALQALERLAPWRADDRGQWLRVGMALHSVSPDLLGAWDDWSRSSDKYERGECPRQWRSFKADGGITLGTLLVSWVLAFDTVGISRAADVSEPLLWGLGVGLAVRQFVHFRKGSGAVFLAVLAMFLAIRLAASP